MPSLVLWALLDLAVLVAMMEAVVVVVELLDLDLLDIPMHRLLTRLVKRQQNAE